VLVGGWAWNGGDAAASAVLDVFAPGSSAPTTATLPGAAYWMGTVVLGDTALLVGDAQLSVWRGGAFTSSALPSELVGRGKDGGGIPGAHVERNGVVVSTAAGTTVGCFYSFKPSALYCYDPATASWSSAPASTMHKGGAIVAAGGTILVAGGYDMDGSNAPTAVVDIFSVA
jgi:hypothetical protein